MKPREILRLFERESIPLFDIREVLSFLGSSLDRAEIDEKDIEDNRVFVVLAKLKEGYPVSYLVGHVDLLSLRILLDENVLIPRTETEDFLADFLSQKDLNGKRVLDLCTGSGFIALAVKKRYPHADVVASDISKAALSLAERSAKLNGLSVRFVHSDYLDDVDGTFDIILSNPPYIRTGVLDTLAPEVRREPRMALDGGADGLRFYRALRPVGEMRNATGAGDATLAGIVYATLSGMDEARTMEVALASGLIAISAPDTISEEMNRTNLETMIKEYVR